MRISGISTPYKIGQMDARHGEAFCPEFVYWRKQDMALYTVGFLSVQPDNACALAYMRSVEAQADEDHENVMAEIAMQRGY